MVDQIQLYVGLPKERNDCSDIVASDVLSAALDSGVAIATVFIFFWSVSSRSCIAQSLTRDLVCNTPPTAQ